MPEFPLKMKYTVLTGLLLLGQVRAQAAGEACTPPFPGTCDAPLLCSYGICCPTGQENCPVEGTCAAVPCADCAPGLVICVRSPDNDPDNIFGERACVDPETDPEFCGCTGPLPADEGVDCTVEFGDTAVCSLGECCAEGQVFCPDIGDCIAAEEPCPCVDTANCPPPTECIDGVHCCLTGTVWCDALNACVADADACPVPCVSAADCDAGQECSYGYCCAAGEFWCGTSGECTDNPALCSPCSAEIPCLEGGGVCDETSGICCPADTAYCEARDECIPTEEECPTPCPDGDECEATETCSNGYCCDTLTAPYWCDFEGSCVEDAAACLEGPCTDDTDCGVGEVCSDGNCCAEATPFWCEALETCVEAEADCVAVECETADDCETGEVCSDGHCCSTGEEWCEALGDCAAECPECETADDCEAGQDCSLGHCCDADEEWCEDLGTCASECVPEEECEEDDDCPGDGVCSDGHCCEEDEEWCEHLDACCVPVDDCGGECESDEVCSVGHCCPEGNVWCRKLKMCSVGELCCDPRKSKECHGECIDRWDDCCAPDQVKCYGLCANTDWDDDHCGDCGDSCTYPEHCLDGVCSDIECSDHEPPLTLCGTKCKDTENDFYNCGRCGHQCPACTSCVEGKCECTPPMTECDGFCVDPSIDANHCGKCFNECESHDNKARDLEAMLVGDRIGAIVEKRQRGGGSGSVPGSYPGECFRGKCQY